LAAHAKFRRGLGQEEFCDLRAAASVKLFQEQKRSGVSVAPARAAVENGDLQSSNPSIYKSQDTRAEYSSSGTITLNPPDDERIDAAAARDVDRKPVRGRVAPAYLGGRAVIDREPYFVVLAYGLFEQYDRLRAREPARVQLKHVCARILYGRAASCRRPARVRSFYIGTGDRQRGRKAYGERGLASGRRPVRRRREPEVMRERRARSDSDHGHG